MISVNNSLLRYFIQIAAQKVSEAASEFPEFPESTEEAHARYAQAFEVGDDCCPVCAMFLWDPLMLFECCKRCRIFGIYDDAEGEGLLPL